MGLVRDRSDCQRSGVAAVGLRDNAETKGAMRLPSRANTILVSSRIRFSGPLQIALLVQLRQHPQTLLQFLPSDHTFARGLLRSFGNVVAGGLALLSSIADVQVRTVFGATTPALAAGISAGAIGFRQGSENRHLRETCDLLYQLAPPGP